jgi:hypothetical protein
MPTCKYCQKDFNRARDTKIYCSDKCRLYHFRGLSVTDKIEEISVTRGDSVTASLNKATDEPVSVTNEEPIEEIVYDDRESNTRAEAWNPEENF